MVPSRQGISDTNSRTVKIPKNVWLKQALGVAQQQAGVVDAIVFPELALSEPQYDVAEQIAFEARAF